MTAEYQREWRKNNPDKVKAYQKKHEQLAAVKAYRKEYSKKWREQNKEKIKASYRIYYLANKEKYFERAWKRIHRRRALRNGGLAEHYTRDKIYDLYGGFCIVCDELIDTKYKYPHKLSLTIHHIMPLSQGGDDTIKNVAPAHWKCNLSVGNKIPIGARPVVYNG
jgi:5-methylcytosine-specific restriction endonuclease McrA